MLQERRHDGVWMRINSKEGYRGSDPEINVYRNFRFIVKVILKSLC